MGSERGVDQSAAARLFAIEFDPGFAHHDEGGAAVKRAAKRELRFNGCDIAKNLNRVEDWAGRVCA